MAGTLGVLRGGLKPGIWDTKLTNVFAGGNQACIEMTISSEVNCFLSGHADCVAKEWKAIHQQLLLAHQIRREQEDLRGQDIFCITSPLWS